MNKSPLVILITGTSTGLGAAVSVALAKQGHKVYASMRNLEKSEFLLKTASNENLSIKTVLLDVQKPGSINVCINQVLQNEGRIDVLINNAGSGFLKHLESTTEAELHEVMDVNFNGVFRCTQAVLPTMRKARFGHIVTISSVGGLVGQPFSELYCAAKFAVEGFIESLASYVTPEFGIRFSLIEPGGISSEFVNSVLKKVSASGGLPEDAYGPLMKKFLAGRAETASYIESHPELNFVQTPLEVAQVVVNCVNNPNPPLRIRTSMWAEKFTELKTARDPEGRGHLERMRKGLESGGILNPKHW